MLGGSCNPCCETGGWYCVPTGGCCPEIGVKVTYNGNSTAYWESTTSFDANGQSKYRLLVHYAKPSLSKTVAAALSPLAVDLNGCQHECMFSWLGSPSAFGPFVEEYFTIVKNLRISQNTWATAIKVNLKVALALSNTPDASRDGLPDGCNPQPFCTVDVPPHTIGEEIGSTWSRLDPDWSRWVQNCGSGVFISDSGPTSAPVESVSGQKWTLFDTVRTFTKTSGSWVVPVPFVSIEVQ